MKVKNKNPEFENWKTERQLNNEGRKIINRDLGIELKPNQRSLESFTYYSPSNTEEMLPDEFEAYKDEQRKIKKERAKELKAIHQEEEKKLNELIQRREEWNTSFQWIEQNRKIKDFNNYKYGTELNENENSVSPFAQDYKYYHISNTEEFSSKEEKENELKRLLKEINKNY